MMIARPSVASLYLQPEFHQASLGSATGFVVERAGGRYLVTNFHVVSGRHPDTGENLHPSGAWPNTIRIVHNAAGQLGQWVERLEPLYDPGASPLWLEHPSHGSKVDTVALPLTDTAGVDVHGYNPWAPAKAALPMAGSLSIIGFPFGVTYGGALAVWVQGFVASEPDFDFGDLPRFLIDSRTRPGQSGSPVIHFNQSGTYTGVGGGLAIGGGVVEDFVGVYLGRINEQSDLGFVWKASALRDVLDYGVRGTVAAP